MGAKKGIDRSKIVKCESSNIQEAWFGLFGPPIYFDRAAEDDFGANVQASAAKALTGLVREPALIFLPKTPIETPPFWTRQFSWDGRKRFARVGRNYLSIHRVCTPPSDRYSDFQQELIAPGTIWMKSVNDLVAEAGPPKANSVTAGYINRFVFSIEEFDPRDHFNLNIAFQVEGGPGEIAVTNMNFGLKFQPAERRHDVSLSIAVTQPKSPSKELLVITTVECRRNLSEEIPMAKENELLKEIRMAQKEAKAQFYAFCSDKTLEEVLVASTK